MSNFKKIQEQQAKIADAVKAINEFFHDDMSYAELMEDAAIAQQEIISVMNAASRPISGDTNDIPDMDRIPLFIYNAMRAFKLLRPFAQLQGQIYGNEE
jgi:hypothetical protein